MARLSTLLATTVALIAASLTSGFVAPSGFVAQCDMGSSGLCMADVAEATMAPDIW